MIKDTLAVSWVEVVQGCYDIYNKIIKEYHLPVKSVVGINRGGTTIAVCLSHLLGINVEILKLTEKKRIIRKNLKSLKKLGMVLFVDDILDTGSTLFTLEEILSYDRDRYPYAMATLFKRHPSFLQKGVVQKTILCRYLYTGKIIKSEKYLIFPWELS